MKDEYWYTDGYQILKVLVCGKAWWVLEISPKQSTDQNVEMSF